MRKKYVKFEDITNPSQKTSKFNVKTTNDILLGEIRWHFPWRQYIFEPFEDTVWSRGCLRQVEDFLQELMDARKRNA